MWWGCQVWPSERWTLLWNIVITDSGNIEPPTLSTVSIVKSHHSSPPHPSQHFQCFFETVQKSYRLTSCHNIILKNSCDQKCSSCFWWAIPQWYWDISHCLFILPATLLTILPRTVDCRCQFYTLLRRAKSPGDIPDIGALHSVSRHNWHREQEPSFLKIHDMLLSSFLWSIIQFTLTPIKWMFESRYDVELSWALVT